ncbi:MAG: hypothetical protein AMS26_20370 [Bacteroides sp. SM23_62]|nr:MAG: hypothetical protein AMS26_20370 [Bacteroides sp. SM23_62]
MFHPALHDFPGIVKNIYSNLIRRSGDSGRLALITILETIGSVPQVQGASALFTDAGLIAGTLGGGILEADATGRAAEAIRRCASAVYAIDLNAGIASKEEAICGGTARLLIDACPDLNIEVFKAMERSIRDGRPGVLVTSIAGETSPAIERKWYDKASGKYQREINACMDEKKCLFTEKSGMPARFFEPVFPLPPLIIAGAGHIGKAVAHLASLLDFEVSVIDDRAEYANPGNIPDAEYWIVDNIGAAMMKASKSSDTYIVIVTRGHKDDAEGLRACLDADVAYIGMIGSKRKISLMREEFISKGWANESQFDRIHAPIGLDIGSKTIQEIAVSICAQLVQVRHQRQHLRKSPSVTAIILGAGESSRMGKPKLLLPFGDTTMIGTVIGNVLASSAEKVIVVLGSNYEDHRLAIKDYPVEIVNNSRYREGMFSSVKCGLKAVSGAADAVMVLLADQPMIGAGEMDKLIESYRDSEKKIIIATHGNKRGHPVLIGSKYIHEIVGYPMQGSLRDILQNHPEDICEVQTDNAAILRDIDTEADYQEELKQHHKHD